MASTAKSKVYGPYNIVSRVGNEGIPFLDLPFVDVANSQIAVSLRDNSATVLVGNQQDGGDNYFYCNVSAELSIWGSIQGYDTLIKRQHVRSLWGPMSLRLTDDDAYNKIVFAGRLFIGGKPGLPSNLTIPSGSTLIVEATVHVQPRGG